MKYADPEAQAEIDRLRAELQRVNGYADRWCERVHELQDEIHLLQRDRDGWEDTNSRSVELGSRYRARALQVEAELDRLRKVLLAEWEKDRKTYAALMEKLK